MEMASDPPCFLLHFFAPSTLSSNIVQLSGLYMCLITVAIIPSMGDTCYIRAYSMSIEYLVFYSIYLYNIALKSGRLIGGSRIEQILNRYSHFTTVEWNALHSTLGRTFLYYSFCSIPRLVFHSISPVSIMIYIEISRIFAKTGLLIII